MWAGHDETLLDEMLKEAEKHSRFLKLLQNRKRPGFEVLLVQTVPL